MKKALSLLDNNKGELHEEGYVTARHLTKLVGYYTKKSTSLLDIGQNKGGM